MIRDIADTLIIIAACLNILSLGIVGYSIYKKYTIIKNLNKALDQLQDLSANFTPESLELFFKAYNVEIKTSPSECEVCKHEVCSNTRP